MRAISITSVILLGACILLSGKPVCVHADTQTIAKPVTVSAVIYGKLDARPVSVGFRPNSPSLSIPSFGAYSTLTRRTSITLTGSKAANTYLYLNNQLTSAPFAATSWSYPVNLVEGNNSFSIFTFASASSQSQTVNASTIVRDTIAPTVSIASPSIGLTKDNSPVLTYSGGDGIVIVQVDNEPVTNLASGQRLGPLSEGEHTIWVYSTDTAGNIGSAHVTFTVDTTRPTLTVSSLADQSYTHYSPQNFSGTVSDAHLSQVTVTYISQGGTEINTPVAVGSDGTFSTAVPLSTSEGGVNTITVIARDLAGNITSDTRTIFYDTNAPVITINTPADNSYTKISPITVSGSLNKPVTVTINRVVVCETCTTFNKSLDLVQGMNSFNIVATDADQFVAGLNRTVIYDNINPSVSISNPGQDIATKNSTIIISGTVGDVDPISATFTFNGVSSPPLTLTPAPNSTTSYSYSFDISFDSLAQGTYPVRVTAMDAAGNQTEATRNIIYDITAPIMTIVPVIPAETGSANLTVAGTVAAGIPGVGVGVSVSNPTSNATEEANIISDGHWSHEIHLLPGSNTFNVTAHDEAGNTTTQMVNIAYYLPAPNLTINPVASSTNNPVIGGTVDAGATVKVAVNGAQAVDVAVSGSYWSYTLSNLQQGENRFTVTAVKPNSYTAAPTVSFIWDTFAPNAPNITSTPVSPTRSGSSNISGTKDANTYLYVNNQLTSASYSDTNWSYASNLSEGSNNFTLFVKDAAGNQSPTASVSLVRDTTPPTLSSATGVTNGSGAITVILADGVSGSGANLNASLAGVVVKKNNIPVAEAGTWTVVGNALVFTPSSQLADGIYTVTINPTDTIGNSGTASFSFTLDRTSPTVQGLVISQPSPFKAGAVTFTFTFSEAMDTSFPPVVTFTKGFFSSTYTLTGSWQNSTAWKGSHPFTAETGDGAYTIKVAGAKDVAANAMSDQEAGSFILDTTSPAAPTVAAVTTLTKIATQTISGMKPADSALVINNVLRVPLNSSTSWNYGYPLVEGVNTLTIIARDAAGNDSLPITPVPVITLDTTPPQFTIDTFKSPSPTVNQTISGKKEPEAVVKLNGTTIFDVTDQSATWSYPVTLIDGISNHLIFTAADSLGNITTKALDILCDTAPPSSLAAGMLVADGSGKGTEVTLSWPSYVETSGLGYYRIYSGPSDYTSVTGLTQLATVNKGTRSYKISGLVQGNRYYFAVVPVSVSGNADSEVHTASALPTDTMPPEEVTGLAPLAGHTAADGNYITLSWTPSINTIGDLADQLLYIDAGQGYDAGTSIGKSVATFTKKGLSDATSYKFKVSTKDTLGHESAGTVVSAMTRLPNPTGLTATPGSQKVTLSWNTVNSPYVKLYNIYRLQSASPQTDVIAMALVKGQSGTSFTDTTGLVNGISYQYAVTTLNSSGAERTAVQSIAVAPRGDTTGPVMSGVNITQNQVITAPVTISASATDTESAMGRMELWIDGVQAANQNGGILSYVWNVVNSTDGNHTVRIAAYDVSGNLSEQAFPVVVSLSPPIAPVITSTFSGSVSQKSVTVTGTAQAGATVSLRVNGVVVSSTSASTSTFSFDSVTLAEGSNSVAAKASNRGGDSPFSADTKITVVTTAPTAPVNLVAKPLAGGSVQFSWQAGGSGAVGYNLYEATTSPGGVTDSVVHKTNSATIPYLLKEYIPADDTPHFYTVTAIDGAGNESPISNVVSITADRAAPTANSVVLTNAAGITPADNVFGPGAVTVSLTASEALSETPFFSLEPQSGSPIVVSLRKSDDTHYTGSFTLDATSSHGPTTWKFSGKDLVGNRGNGSGTGITIDVKGPAATVTAPLTLLKTTTGPISVVIVFDEPSTTIPTLTLKVSDGITAQITGLASADSGLNWSGTLDPSALAEGSAQFLLAGSRDRFGNIGSTIKTGGSILLYKTAPPASAVPAGLAAKPGKGGSIALSWTKVADAQGYNVYRQGTGDSAPILINSISSGATVAFTDTPAGDGSYAYSVSSLGLLGVESVQSSQVTAASDRTTPPVPTGLTLALSGNGVQANWDAMVPPAEIPVSYRLYRSNSVITDISGLTPLLTVKSTPATDSSPTKALRFYAVTALDALGNESAPSPTQEITFPVAPVGNLTLTLVDDGKPTLSWNSGEAGLQGFYIYRNGSKINQTPTISTTYSDGYYSSGSVTYGVSAVDANGTESPVKGVTLPTFIIALKDGTAMHRGVLETITLLASIPADAASSLNIDAVAVKIGTLPESSENGPFTVIPGTPLEIKKVAATEANAPPQEAVVVTAVMHPAPGTTVRLTKSSLASVLGSGTALEIFNEPLIRGTRASVRIKVNSLGSARSEFLTSENGGATSHVTVYLKDQDGNLLAQGNLSQRTGSAVVNSGSYATARLEPGESFLSEPITFTVPATAPYKVSLEAVIDNNYYHYKQDDQVIAPGIKQSAETTIADVSYTAQAATDKSVYKQGESVVISGQSISTTSGQQMPLVPVKIGLSVKGFDRFFTVNTNQAGSFSYTFTPASNEAGSYSVWATHPDISGRSIQAQFSIIGLQVSPLLANMTTTRNRPVEVPVTLKNLTDTAINGLIFTPSSSSGISAIVVNGGSDRLAGGETRTVTFRLTPDATAPDSGFASLTIATAEGLSEKVDANVTLINAIPVIKTMPSYIDTGIVRGNQKIATFTISNTGIETLRNARIEGPSLPWMTLTLDKNIGNIDVGLTKEIGIQLKPAETVPQGIFDDRVVIYSDNHIPYIYNIQVTVTSSAVGSVRFNVMDSLLRKVGGANVTLQHQTVPDLYYSLATAADGTVSVTDIPEGRYSYNVSAAGHKPFGGSFVITPGIWTNVPVALEVTLVQIEWSVTPVIIEDRYEITIKQTFETNVPTPVIVTEPPGMALPLLQPGQVFNGEFTISNYGLISADFKGFSFPNSFGDYDLELLANVPSKLNAMQKITVPYKVTRRLQTVALSSGTSSVASLYEDVKGFGGSSCSGSTAISSGWGYTICPNTENERSASSSTAHTITYNDCQSNGSNSAGGSNNPSSQPPSSYVGGGPSLNQDTGNRLGALTPLPDAVVVCIIPIPCEGSECDSDGSDGSGGSGGSGGGAGDGGAGSSGGGGGGGGDGFGGSGGGAPSGPGPNGPNGPNGPDRPRFPDSNPGSQCPN